MKQRKRAEYNICKFFERLKICPDGEIGRRKGLNFYESDIYYMKKIDESDFKNIVSNSITMSHAAVQLGLHFNTFKRIAIKLGVYIPNQGGKGTKKAFVNKAIPLEEILQGMHPTYQTFKLKNRMLAEGVLTNECSCCKITEWNGKSIALELDHIDGVRSNHRLENLRLLCPNCHSQTDTFRSKNRI